MTRMTVRIEDFDPIERSYCEAQHELCDELPPGHPLAAHSPWSGSDLDGVEPWTDFVARLARHGLAIVKARPTQTYLYDPSCPYCRDGSHYRDAAEREKGLDVERLVRAMRKAATYTSTGHGRPPRQMERWGVRVDQAAEVATYYEEEE